MKHYSAELWPPPTKFNTMNEFAETIEWEQGMIVEWRALDGVGRIVHIPNDQQILMVDVLEQEDGEWMSTGYTLTAGYQDVVPIDGANNR